MDDFLLQVKGTREEKTLLYYTCRLTLLVRWAQQQGVGLASFRARDLRQYLAARADAGVSDATRRHDAVASRAFLKFCKREGYIEGDPLSGYQVPKSPTPYVKCPSEDEVRVLLRAVQERWKPSINLKARFIPASARLFFTRRNFAVIAGLIETGARIGEMLALKLDDFQKDQRQIAIRSSKGDEPRIVPISDAWTNAVDAYLRVRPKIESDRLFINEYGEPLSPDQFGRIFRSYARYAGLSGFTLHGLRHYAITQLAKTDVWAASVIAGHKDLKITRQYLHHDPDHLRSVHSQAAPLARLLVNARSQRQRKRII